MAVTFGKRPGPRKLLLYANHGVGKSTFASQAPSPAFIDIEEGTRDLDVARWDTAIQSFTEFISVLEWFRREEHDFKTLVIDTIDWLEKLIFKDICSNAGVTSVADIDYGKGYPRAIPKWEMVLSTLDAIQRDRRMGIILLSHARLEKVANPEGVTYDRYAPDLWTNSRNEGVGNMVQEWCSEVFFARKQKFVRTEGKGFNERGIATGTEEREMLTSDSAYASAKNRLNMPPVIPMLWSEYQRYILANRATGNIAGVVSNGSSRPPTPPDGVERLAEMEQRFAEV